MAKLLDTPTAVRRAAMDHLARREHGRVELQRKLSLRGASEALIDRELDRLAAEGLLSESRFVQSYIASRARAGFGPLRIADELGRRGLSREVIRQALAASDRDWSALLVEIWQRKFAQLPQDAKALAKQGRFLSGRGFALEAIMALLKSSHLG